MSTVLYWLIIAIVITDFLFGVWLLLLSIKASKNPIPKVLEGLYGDEKYATQQSYLQINRKVAFVSSSVTMLVSLGFFAFGGYGWLDSVVRDISSSTVLRTLLFFGAIYVVSFLISLPFSIYETFVVEEKYGFNKSTPKLFTGDTIKSFFLTALINGGLLALCAWVYTLNPRWFWLIAWGIYLAFVLFFQYFYSELIVPLFNKQKPLEEGELRAAIESFAAKTGFELENIYVMDESKRSTKANAYFTGYGKKKRVVLFDTLIAQLTTDEIVGILAHEIGHYKHGHLIKDMVSSSITTLVTFWLFSLLIGNEALAAAAGSTEPSFWLNFAIFSILLTPLNLVLGIVTNVISRRHEHQADAFAKKYKFGPAEASGIKKISAQALSNLTPHPVVVFVEHSHPTLADRVTFLESPDE